MLDGPCFLHIIVCGLCMLSEKTDEDEWDSEDFETKELLYAHLDEHRKAGHIVPESAMDRIRDDDWIP